MVVMILYFIGEDVKNRGCFEVMKSAVNYVMNPKVLFLILTTEDKTRIDKYYVDSSRLFL